MKTTYSWRWTFVFFATLSVAGSAFAAAVRPISDAERAAVQIAVDYLHRGPEAVASQLTAGSPLRKVSAAEINDEIEVRLGPPNGATWELQTVVPALRDKMAVFTISFPSGVDETAVLELVPEGGSFKVQDIRILAQRSKREALLPPLPAENQEAARGGERSTTLPLILGLIAAALAAGGALLFGEDKDLARKLIIAAPVVVFVAVIAVFVKGDPRFMPSKRKVAVVEEKPKEDASRMAALLPLRRAVAAGTEDVTPLLNRVPGNSPLKDAAKLWKAQLELQQMNIESVKKALRSFETPSDIPMVEMLRARVELFLNNEAAAAMAYERAVNLGPGRDALWHETAQALSVLGFKDRAERYYDRLSKIGSRDGSVYYSLAALAAEENDQEASERHLREAWRLQPVERGELVESAVLWSVLRRPGTAVDVNLSAPAEPLVRAADMSTRPIQLPIEANPRVSGTFLHINVGEQELLVPGGAALAPIGTLPVEASAWARSEEEKGLRDFPNLVSMARNPGAFAQPALRNRISRTASALGNRNRWADLVQLTEGLEPRSEHIPSDLFFLRAVALQRMRRDQEAIALLTSLAASPVLQRKRDAQALAELAEMLVAYDLFDQAIRMYDKSQAIRPNGMIDDRVRQIQMNRTLASKYSTHRTEHFEIHYPEDVSVQHAENMGTVLEAEFKRLLRWIPVPNMRPVVVNVVWWREFRATYTGSDFILGFYVSNKITVPLAGIGSFRSEIVTLLTHELCHAMIAQATNEQAPRWFHEGLAQRVEMRSHHPNAFNMYDDHKLLAVSLLDSVMEGSPDPEMITEAYIESQTVIRYIEAKYGMAGIHRMLGAFAGGATSEDAIRSLSGSPVETFDANLRAWGRSSSGVFENPEPIHYDREDLAKSGWRPNEQPKLNMPKLPKRGGIGG